MSGLRVPVTEADHRKGKDTASCVLVEYGDYQCPYCRAAHPVVARLERHFSERLLFVFRNFPLTNIHAFAEVAAETAEFANDRGFFWEMHDLIFKNQPRLGLPLLTELTRDLGMNLEEFDQSLQQGLYRPKIHADFSGGVRSGVNGTPTFFVNGIRYNGPHHFDDMAEAITNAL